MDAMKKLAELICLGTLALAILMTLTNGSHLSANLWIHAQILTEWLVGNSI